MGATEEEHEKSEILACAASFLKIGNFSLRSHFAPPRTATRVGFACFSKTPRAPREVVAIFHAVFRPKVKILILEWPSRARASAKNRVARLGFSLAGIQFTPDSISPSFFFGQIARIPPAVLCPQPKQNKTKISHLRESNPGPPEVESETMGLDPATSRRCRLKPPANPNLQRCFL